MLCIDYKATFLPLGVLCIDYKATFLPLGVLCIDYKATFLPPGVLCIDCKAHHRLHPFPYTLYIYTREGSVQFYGSMVNTNLMLSPPPAMSTCQRRGHGGIGPGSFLYCSRPPSVTSSTTLPTPLYNNPCSRWERMWAPLSRKGLPTQKRYMAIMWTASQSKKMAFSRIQSTPGEALYQYTRPAKKALCQYEHPKNSLSI